MSSSINSNQFTKLVATFSEGVEKYLPDSSEETQVVLESTPLFQISYASLKNFPYAYSAKEFGINDLGHMLKTRVIYIEATLLCLISAVHNLCFGLIYSALVVGTLGLYQNFRNSCKIHWIHMFHGLLSVGIGLLGTLLPYYGMAANAYLLYSIMESFKACYQKDISRKQREFVEFIQNMSIKYSSFFYDLWRSRVSWSEYEYIYRPSLKYIEGRIHSAQKMDDLWKLAKDIFDQWPKMGLVTDKSKEFAGARIESPAGHHHYV